jgi:transmembrane 9 superfamily protein 2/4
MLSALAGNGAQLCAMVGVTLGGSGKPRSPTSDTKLGPFSLCFVGLPFALKSWLTCHGNDDLLDFLRQVRLGFTLSWSTELTLIYSVSGYVSSRVYSSLGGTERKKNAFLTATVLPTYV